MFDDDQETPNTLTATYEFDEGGKKKMMVFEVRHWITNHEAGIGGDEAAATPSATSSMAPRATWSIDGYGKYCTYLGKEQQPGPARTEGGRQLGQLHRARAQPQAGGPERAHRGRRHLDALVHLANISYRLGRTLNFDAASYSCAGDAEANGCSRAITASPSWSRRRSDLTGFGGFLMIRKTLLFCAVAGCLAAAEPLVRVVDLDAGETQKVQLADGKPASVKLLSISETRDKVRNAIRSAAAEVEVNGARATLACGNYHLPVAAGGVQVDCAVTKAYYDNSNADHWKLTKLARLRLWPKGSRFLTPKSMVYPVRQRWFATPTQMTNEPTYVDGGEGFGKCGSTITPGSTSAEPRG